MTDGGVITIDGNDFGTKSTATPLVFENFDTNDTGRQDGDTLRGEDCSHYGSWRDSSWDHVPTFEADNNRTGSTLAGYYPLVAADTSANHSNGWIDFSGSHQSTLLISVWIRYTYANVTGVGNVKTYHVSDGIGDSDANISTHCGAGNNDPDRGFFMQLSNGNGQKLPAAGDSTRNFAYPNDGSWENNIFFIKAGDSGTANGSMIIWRDGSKLEDTSSMITWTAGDSWQTFVMGYYVANYTTGNIDIYADDIYIDNSWQSVWIGNSSTWSSCTHREVQIPTIWTKDRIELTFNQGSFKAGETIYFFVVDNNGDPSNGKEMVIGIDSGTTTIITPPDNLQIVNTVN